MEKTIGNPLSWTAKALLSSGEKAAELTSHVASDRVDQPPVVQDIGVKDIGYALRRGFDDFGAFRSDVIGLCLVYPAIGLVLVAMSLQASTAALIFPLVSGFAILGPVAAVGMYEMSRLREAGKNPAWSDALFVFRAPSFGAVLAFGLYLVALFGAWLIVANGVYGQTVGTIETVGAMEFVRTTLNTPEGWTMMAVGIPLGGVFAVVALAMGLVTVPLLLDRDVGLPVAIGTSLRLVLRNPVTCAIWGGVIALSLAIAAVPFLLGLVIVVPVLGHSSWHFYRRAVG